MLNRLNKTVAILVPFYYGMGLFLASAQPSAGPYPVPPNTNVVTNNPAASMFIATNNIRDIAAQNAVRSIVNDYTLAGYAAFFVDGLLEHPLFNPTNHLSLLGHGVQTTNESYINEGFVFAGSNSTIMFPLPVQVTNWTLVITLNRRPLGGEADIFAGAFTAYGMEGFSMINTSTLSEVLTYSTSSSMGLAEANKGAGAAIGLTTLALTNNYLPLMVDGYSEPKNYLFAEDVLIVSHTSDGNSTIYENCTPDANALNSAGFNIFSGGAGITCTDLLTTLTIGYVSSYWKTQVVRGFPFEVVSSAFLFSTNCGSDITNYNNLVAVGYRMGIRSLLKTKMTLISGDSVMWPSKQSGSETRCITNNPIGRYIEQNPSRIVLNYARPGSNPVSITNGGANHMPNNAMPPVNQFKMLPETVTDKELITDDGRNSVGGGVMNWQDMVTFFNYMWGPSKTNYGVKITAVMTRAFTNFVDPTTYKTMTNFYMFNAAQRTNFLVDRIVDEGELINTNWLLAPLVSDDGIHLNGTNQEPNIAFAKLMSGNTTKRTFLGTKSMPSIGYTNWTSQTWNVIVTNAVVLTVFDAGGGTIIPAFSGQSSFILAPLQFYTATSSTAVGYQVPIDIK